MEVKETHEKILNILRQKGPSLPINISKQMGMNSLFVSAFLSEMVGEKRVKISHMKVGGSPLYFLDGQEEKLEGFSNYLPPRENEAFMLLKENKILKDDEQEPAIRVALRSISDFAVGFKQGEEIYWRYALVSEEEVREILEPKKIISVPVQIRETERGQRKYRKVVRSEREAPVMIIKDKKKISEFENPLVIKEKKKEKPKSEFVLGVINIIKQRGFEIVEEREHKPKEYNCIVRIKSELGAIDFLCQAKDKKKISETDFKKLLSDAQKIPLPALMISTAEVSKKAEGYLKRYESVLKWMKI